MSIKFSDLATIATVDDTVIVPVVDVSGTPTSKKTTVGAIKTYVLTGGLPLATAVDAGTVKIGPSITVDVAGVINVTPATDTTIGGVIVGSGISVDGDGVISVDIIPVATTSVAGTVIVGDGIGVDINGTISVPTRKFHGFSIDANSNLIYSTTTDTTINLQNEYGADIYEDTDIGTNDYAYSMDADGNLIVTFS